MSQLAKQHNALNLSQGFPDFKTSDELNKLVFKYMQSGYNQYAPMQGVPELREAIAMKMERLYNIKYQPETEITVTAGATQAIFTAIAALINEGDEVMIFTPAYDCYTPAVEIFGGNPVYVQLHAPEYRINWEEVKKLYNRKVKLIIINTPHNPTGAILSAQDMMKLEKLIKDSDTIVLSDEVYEHIIFDGYEHQSIARFPELARRSIAVYSFGKTFHNTGWKIGYCVAPENIMQEFRKVHQYNVFSCNTPIQYALAEYLQNEEHYLYLSEFYQKKRDLFNQSIETSRFRIHPSAGTYFQLLDYRDISDEKDVDFAVRLTKEYKIASIPVSVFYNKPPEDTFVLRFCFAKEDETLLKAAEILCKI
jgi:methionine aminotransferase